MVYQAPLLALGLGFVYIWRTVCLKISAKFDEQFSKTGLWFSVTQYYTPLYIGMGYLCFGAIQQSLELLGRDGDFFNSREEQEQVANVAQNELEAFHSETAFLYSDPWMIYLSVYLAIPSLIGTFFCGLWHTISHIKEVYSKGMHLNKLPRHDQAMQIVALPIIYGLMSFKSMMRMWQVCMNDTTGPLNDLGSFHARKNFLNQMYEANFSVADLYEAWALFHFASLAVDVIKQFAAEKNMKIKNNEDGKPGMGKTLVNAIDTLTNQGIYGFIFSCVLQSAYCLILTSGEFYGDDDTAASFRARTESLEAAGVPSQIKGAGFLASSLAIANVVQIEVAFHAWLHEFAPGPKFLSTKVLVSLAFMQSLILALPPFNGWSVTGQNMFYASLLCVECFFVSLLHVYAWPKHEEWYRDEKIEERFRSSLTEPLKHSG